MTGGKPRYKTVKAFSKHVDEYLKHCKESGDCPFIVGMAAFHNIPLGTLENIGRNDNFKEEYQRIKTASHTALLVQGLKGNYKEKLVSFVLRTHYADSYEIKDNLTEEQVAPSRIEIVLAEPAKESPARCEPACNSQEPM